MAYINVDLSLTMHVKDVNSIYELKQKMVAKQLWALCWIGVTVP